MQLKVFFAKRTTVQKIGLVFRQYQANKTNNNILLKSKQNCSRVRNFDSVKRKQNVHAAIKVKTGNKDEKNGMKYHRRQQCQHR